MCFLNCEPTSLCVFFLLFRNVIVTFRSFLFFVILLKPFSKPVPCLRTPKRNVGLCILLLNPGSLLFLSTAAVIVAANPHILRPQAIGGIFVRGGGNAKEDGLYSFSLTTFSPRGSLTQIEYAINAAQVRLTWT